MKADWEKIEQEYRAGQLSVREIARQHDISEGAIRKRVKKEGWIQDLSSQVRQAVRTELVRSEVRTDNATAKETIEAAAVRAVHVVREHRKDIAQGRSLIELMMGQLNEAATSRDEIENAIIEETAGDSNTKRRASMLKAVSLPTHAGVIRDLSTAMKNVVYLERQAFNLDEKASESDHEKALDLLK